MGNFIFLLSESWSTMAADQFFGMFWPMMRFLAGTALVALLAYFVTKKMAGARFAGQKSGNLAIVESINVGGQAIVQLVKAGEKYIVIGVTKERITLLGEVDKDDIVQQAPVDLKTLNTPFGKVLSRFIKDSQEDEPKPGDDGHNE